MTMLNPPHPGGLITEYLEDNEISLRALPVTSMFPFCAE
uniref:Uncharacterized protein n=1 Tax=Salmonella enterica subsp. enterica serovar London TaxID=149390 RepID=A0A3G8EXL2_SALET|nr:hypothetical protein KADIGFNM_00123 [Salmonella enterica subsp. enterica serovar London]AZF85627.1 hypothetical protein KADIGFNM_00290 [Salmonella enterica subsp. enterica serovar London]